MFFCVLYAYRFWGGETACYRQSLRGGSASFTPGDQGDSPVCTVDKLLLRFLLSKFSVFSGRESFNCTLEIQSQKRTTTYKPDLEVSRLQSHRPTSMSVAQKPPQASKGKSLPPTLRCASPKITLELRLRKHETTSRSIRLI